MQKDYFAKFNEEYEKAETMGLPEPGRHVAVLSQEYSYEKDVLTQTFILGDGSQAKKSHYLMKKDGTKNGYGIGLLKNQMVMWDEEIAAGSFADAFPAFIAGADGIEVAIDITHVPYLDKNGHSKTKAEVEVVAFRAGKPATTALF